MNAGKKRRRMELSKIGMEAHFLDPSWKHLGLTSTSNNLNKAKVERRKLTRSEERKHKSGGAGDEGVENFILS